ncbi:MAG: FtsX-like permease family protein, partial [Dehalococcoidia bacterium]|nr:FtsX-like permease family protein [Dehalococcoidia bacterium]
MTNKKTINERLNAIAYGIIATWQLVAKRALAHWRLLSYVVIGVVLASAILSGTVIYFEALRELALKNSLERRTQEQLNITVRASRGPTNNEEYGKVNNVIVPLVNRHVAWMLRDSVHAARTPTFYLGSPGSEESVRDGDDRTFFAYIDDLEERIPLIEGAQPSVGTAVGRGQPLELEALVPLEAMQELGAQVGDRFAAVPTISSDIPHVYVTISGAFDWEDTNDAELVHFTEKSLQTQTMTTDLRLMPFFISRQAFLEALGPSIGSMSAGYYWYLKTDPSLINADNAQLTVANIQVMASRSVASLQTVSQTTGLDDALIEYDQRLFFSRLPMFIVLILIAFVILYYVATMSSLLVENQRSEVAQFRSRGSDTSQILMVFILEGATIAVLAAIVAPIIAAFTISLLGLTPAFFGLTGGGLLSVEISPSAYALSVLGGVLGFVALLIPAI